MIEQPNLRGALLWHGGVILANGVWGYVAGGLGIPFVPFITFTLVIASASLFPPQRFKLWPSVNS